MNSTEEHYGKRSQSNHVRRMRSLCVCCRTTWDHVSRLNEEDRVGFLTCFFVAVFLIIQINDCLPSCSCFAHALESDESWYCVSFANVQLDSQKAFESLFTHSLKLHLPLSSCRKGKVHRSGVTIKCSSLEQIVVVSAN